MYEEQEQRTFIGHGEELEVFQEWLDETDPRASSILFFHEESDNATPKGGIGKSWILRECRDIALARKYIAIVLVDFFSIQDRDGVEIARRIVDGLKRLDADWSPAAFDALYEQYQQARQSNAASDYLVDLRRKMHYRLRDALDDLQRRFGDTRKRLLVFCDTYERIEQNPEAMSLLPTHHFLETYHIPSIGFVMAGRNKPDSESKYWRAYSQKVRGRVVSAFTVDDVARYLGEHLVTGDVGRLTMEQIRRIHKQTQGRPIMVGLVTDVLNRKASLEKLLAVEPERFESYLLWQVSAAYGPGDWAVRFMSHLHHRFHRRLLVWLLRELGVVTEEKLPETVEEAWEALLRSSFIRHSTTTDEITLHDEMRQMVIRIVWAAEEGGISERRELSEYAIRYYDQAIAAEESEPLLQAYRVEKLYHQLYLDPVGNFRLLKEQLENALKLKQNNVAHVLLQETRELVLFFSKEQQYRLEEYAAWLLQNEENFTGALKKYQDLLAQAEPQWVKGKQADLLMQQGVCYTRLNQFSDAIYALKRAAEIYEAQNNIGKVGVVFSRTGYAYEKQGELDTAAKYYQTSIEIARREKSDRSYADSLSSLGGTRRLQGKLSEALRDCRIALRIREELNAKNDTSDIVVGYSLRAVGHVYYDMNDKFEAEKYYRRAYNIFENNFYRAGVATIANRFGVLSLDRGNVQEAQNWFEKAYQIGLDSDGESVAESLYRQSQLLCMSGKHREALSLLARAIEWAREMKYHRQQAEWQMDQARMLLQIRHMEEAQRVLEDTEALAANYSYYFLSGKIAGMRGNIAYEAGEYPVAFQFYTRCCYFMALYNRTEYDKAAERMVMKRLLDLPDKRLLRQIWEQLNEDWSALDLEEEPLLMRQMLEEVKERLSF